MEEFIAIGPGVTCETATMSVNWVTLIHLCDSTTSFCIRGSIAYPPPKLKSPILKNTTNKAHNSAII